MGSETEHIVPRLAGKLLHWLCKDELLEEIEGDLQEQFRIEFEKGGRRKALLWYWYHTLHFLRPFALKKPAFNLTRTIMTLNHFKVAFRRLRKNKVHTAINVFGLSLGLTAFTLILLFVRDETNYDTFHQDADKVLRLGVSLNIGGQVYNEASIQFPAAPALMDEFPDIQNVVRVYKDGNFPLMQYEDQKYIEDKLFFVDEAFFQVFGYELVAGNPETVLSKPASILLTQSSAEKYFGSESPLGKTIKYQGNTPLTVTGVIGKPGANTHFEFDFLMPMSFRMAQWERISGLNGREKKWFWTGAWTYLRLNENASKESLAEKLPSFLDKYFPERYKTDSEFIIQPIKDIHLKSALNNEIESNGNTTYVIIFGAVAIAVLFIACINFINLNTIQAINRVKEIGTRRALGARQGNLAGLILGESFLITSLSVGTSTVLTYIFLGPFNALTDKGFSIQQVLQTNNLFILFSAIIIVGLCSGLYPVSIVTGHKTVDILKGTARFGGSSPTLRKLLITIQFTASIALIIGILVINRQLNYLNEKEMGYDPEDILVLSARRGVNQQFEAFKEELLKNPSILQVTAASTIPGYGPGSYRFIPEGGQRSAPIGIPLLYTSFDYTKTMNIELLEGRDFEEGSPVDREQGFILNEKAVAELGWEGNAIGKKLEHFGPGVNTIAKSGYVIGVVKDFHFESLHHDVRPLVMSYAPFYGFYMIRSSSNDLRKVIDYAETKWATFEKDWPMDYFLLNSELQRQYHNEQKLSKTIIYFTVIAVIVASIGLYALGAYLVLGRSKEIGIRKVLGANKRQVFALIHSSFFKLILIANLVAWPLAFLFVRDWLQNFAYSASIHPGHFLLAAAVSLLLVILTISYHANRINKFNLSNLVRNE